MSEENVERRLTTILAADVVGYSRLMAADEVGTLAQLKTHRKELIEPKTAEYHGRLVKLMGDGTLMEFTSVVDAVRFAVDLQRTMAERNAGVPQDRRIAYRIGINIGDIIVEGDDIYGDGVNVGARLEALAEPGGICLSRPVHTQVKGKVDLAFRDLGEQEVKNIPEAVQVFQVLLDAPAAARRPVGTTPAKRALNWPALAGGLALLVIVAGVAIWQRPWEPREEPASVADMAFPLPDKPSIAVLPFANLGGDQAQEYFSDGMTNDIITDLSKFSNLFVIASNSTFSYKGKAVKVRQVAEELGVRYVLEGSIQRSGEMLRINAQLIDATTGRHLWAERYDRSASDFFAIQDEIVRTIVATLASQVEDAEIERALKKGTEDLRAYDYYQRAVRAAEGVTKEANNEARELFEKAIELDPTYMRPYHWLTWVHRADWAYRWSEDPERSFDLVLETARKAVALEPHDYESHWALGFAYLTHGEFDRAEAEYERALALNPNDDDLLVEMAELLVKIGRAEQAVAQIETGMRINPRHPDWYWWNLGWAQYFAGQYDEALAALNRLSNPPNGVRRTRGAVLVRLGRTDEAREVISKFIETDLEMTLEEMQARAWKDREALERWIEDLRTAGLPERRPLSLPDKPSIAVLPFNNMSEDRSQEYFADGMTEDLITDLSKISGLFVIARNSSFAYKGKQVKVREVAEELGVRYVLEGSVRRAGDEVRINAQLIDATTGGHLWAERYDGTLDDIFDLQDSVTEQIVAALAVSLTGEERAQQARHGTENAAAHDAYLQGWAHYKLLTPEDLARAVPFFEEAIRLDPNYARAHAALASLYWDAYQNDWAFNLDMPSFRAEARANEHLEEALKSPNPLAHVLQSRMFAAFGFPDDAVVEAEKSVALDGNDATALAGLADALVRADRAAEGLEHIEQARRLDPHHPPSYLITLGAAQFGLEKYEEAALTFERAVKRNPDSVLPLVYLASSYGHLGRIKDADNAIEAANDIQAELGMGDLTLERKSADSGSPFQGEIDFPRFGGKPAQARVRAGLSDIPALTWQYRVTVHTILGAGNSWYEVEGATEIDISTVKSLHDRGAVFVDTSHPDRWKEQHIPGAVHLPYYRDLGPLRFTEDTLMAVADKTEEIVLYCDDPDCDTGAVSDSAKAANWGYQKVYYFEGGAQAWKDAGYPVETGQ